MHGFSHMLVSGLVHGVIYKVVWHLTLPEAAGLVAVVLGRGLSVDAPVAPVTRKYRDTEGSAR